ncbi:unannotated protein [freshwater metagenome]|jgi:rhodanese-related sulfurtransferase|uniref:Unannotated protein n=1 Tax=freshwater metagenome TaxID=449393 RepID=A0A6J7FV90_9ZZZZ|nr:rhodanese-like domain-containing protein [Actinomycetota bacterium]
MLNLDAAEFAQKITQPSVVLLDVRTPAEFNEGHIPNAVNIDVLADYFTADIETLDKSKAYAIYCRSGKRSLDAAYVMGEVGFDKTFNLTGGIIEWVEAGKPTVS